ncbi:MAG: hypothetical protein ACK4UJ_05230 [Leptonema sp. (in: bacteria)]
MKKIYLLFFTFFPLFAIPLSYLQFPFFSTKESKSKEYFIQGVRSFNDMSYEASKDFFLKSLNIKPDFYFARRYLAEAYLLSGELENSLDEYEILKNQYPNNEFINYKIQKIENLLIDKKNLDLFFGEKKENFIFWKEISIKDIKEKNLTPIDIQKDEKNIFILNYEPKSILVFDYEGNLKETIKGILLNKLNKPSSFLYYNNRLYISDFGSDEVHIYNTLRKRFEDSIRVAYPDKLFVIQDELYIWSRKEKQFYKYSLKNRTLSSLKINFKFDDVLEYNYATDGESIYLSTESTIFKIDISGILLKEISTDIKKINKIQISNNKIYLLDSKSSLWELPLQIFSGEEIKKPELIFIPKREKFKNIFSFYKDNEILVLGDLEGTIYFYNNQINQNQNLDFIVTNIEAKNYPLVSLHLKIFDSFSDKSFENLENHHFEIYENEKRVYRINTFSRNQFLDKLNVLFLYDTNFLDEEFKFEKIFKENLFSFFEQFRVNDQFLFGIMSDNLKIVYKAPYPIDVYSLMKEPPIKEKGQLLKNIIQAIYQLIPLKGKKSLVVFTNDTSEFSREVEWKKILFLSRIYTIPIFVISLQNQNPDLMRLAQQTRGKYYYFFSDYYYKDIYHYSKKIPYYDYIITYDALTEYNPNLKDRFINVKVKLKYLQMGGYAESGYLIP